MSDQTTVNGKIDKQALLAKYLAERDKRLRADGNAQYLRLEGQLSHYKRDPYAEPINREALFDHVTFAFVGGGIAGLVTGARLVEAGVTDVRIVEKGGDFGGTWYWNRYPGAQCDTASMVYMPLLEETGHMPIGEIRARPRNSRAVPAHRPQVWPLRQCAVSDRGDRPRMGRQREVLGDLDRSRRSFHRELHRRRHRSAARAEAAGHSRYRQFRGPFLPHQPLGLRLHRRRCGRRADDEACRQACRHHRHRRDLRAGRAVSGAQREPALCRAADAVLGRCARQCADRCRMVRRHRDAGLADSAG